MSALGGLVVKLALDYAEYTQGLDRSSQEALKFAKNAQGSFDQASRSTKEFLTGVAGNVAGAVTSVVGLNAAFTRVRDSINVLESLDDAAQKTGSSVEDLSRIAKVAKNFGDAFEPIEQGITKLAKGLAQIDNPSSDAIRALDAIGVSARDSNGQLRTAADVYIDVAKSLQQYKDGAEKTAVATALFGKNGAELLPVLNNLAQGIDSVKATSAASAQQAAMFNDAVAKSKATVNGLFMSLAVDLLPTLNNIAGAINQSTGQIGGFSVASESAKVMLKGLAIAAYTVVDTFQGIGREIGARAAQIAALARMDFNGAKFIGQALAEDSAKSRAAYDKFVDTVWNGEKKISAAVDVGEKKLINYQLQIPSAVDSATKSIEKQVKVFDMELYKLKEYDKEASRARDITQSVATKQEIYNQTLEELERLKPYLSIETYNRALEKAQKALDDTGVKNRTVVTEMDQLWMQAGRNIQSTLANSIFDFFSGGLDDMWRNTKVAVGRILSEFAALKLAQSIGLTAMFAVPGSASAAGDGFNLNNAINLGSMGSNALSMFKSGFGTSSLVRGGLGFLGGSFGAGASGAASAGVFGAGGLPFLGGAGTALGGAGTGAAAAATEFGTMATMGASMAAMAGPAIAAFAADQLFRMLAGDKLIGGGVGKVLNYVPVLGPLLNGLFGRGPMKQQGTLLSGEIGAEGFESGYLQTRFKAKGGLFRSDKIDYARVDAMTGEVWTDNNKLLDFAKDLSKTGKELFGLINDTTKQTSSSLRQIGQDLGVSTEGIDKFKYSINLLSEKGKMLSEEQIGQEIEKITDGLAHSLIPQVDELAKRGETALQTVSRLGTEFTSLVDAAALLLGKSVADARTMVKGASFEDRTGLIDSAGGLDKFNQDVAYFSQNFLSDAERLVPVQEKLDEQLTKLGLSTDLTKDQFKSLVQSFGQVNGITKETFVALLDLAPAFVQVRDAASTAVDPIKKAMEALGNPQKLTAAIAAGGTVTLGSHGGMMVSGGGSGRDPYVERFERAQNKLIDAVTQANVAYETATAPLIEQQKNLKNLNESINELRTSIDASAQSGFTSAEKYISARNALSTATPENIGERVKNYLDIAQTQAKSRLDYMGDVDFAKATLASMSASNQNQIDGIGNRINKYGAARSESLMSALLSSGYLSAARWLHPGGMGLELPKELESLSAAIFRGLDYINRTNAMPGPGFYSKLPKFAQGTDYVPFDMPAIIHKGERITPAEYNRSDATNAELVAELRQIRQQLKDTHNANQATTALLERVMFGGDSIRMTAV